MTDPKLYAGGIYKMAGGQIAAILPNAKLGIDKGRMSVQVVICTDAIDRDRERILPKGLTTLNHSRNPQVDFQHNSGLPIGMAKVRTETGYTGDYTVKMDARGRLVGETFFHQDTEIGNQVFEMIVKGALPGVSLTMLPVPALVKKYDTRDGGRPITVYEAGDLVAYSHVVQQSNPECLAEIVHKGIGGKPLCRELKEQCEPIVGERNPVVTGGWDSLAEVRKYLPPGQPEPQDDMAPPPLDDDPNGGKDHHANVKDGIGTAMASIYEEYDAGNIDIDDFVERMRTLAEASHHAKHGKKPGEDDADEDDPDEEMDLDEEPDPDDLDEDEDDDEDEFIPSKEKREKFYQEYTPAMKNWITKSYRLANTLVGRLDRGEKINPAKLKAVCEQLLTEAETLEPVTKEIKAGRLVSKAAWPTIELDRSAVELNGTT